MYFNFWIFIIFEYDFKKHICTLLFSNFIYHIENSNNTISTTTCEHISAVAEINWETGSTQISDLCTWFEHVVTVEYFNFIWTTSTCDNQVTSVLLELCTIDQAWFFRWKAFIPIDVFDWFASTEIPELKWVVWFVGASEKISVVKINRITTNVWPIYWSDWWRLSNIPNFDIVIPRSWNNKIRVFLIKFNTENSIRMSWLSCTTTFKFNNKGSCLFIIYSNNCVGSSSYKLCSSWIIINCKKLIQLIMDSMQEFSRCCMPMLQSTICVNRNDDVLCYGLAWCWSPSHLGSWHWCFHICVQNVWLFSIENIEYTDCAVTAALSDIFVMWVISYAKGLCI